MLIIPAIDLLNGQAVRLFKGDYEQMKVYSSDPAELALEFQQAGTRLIHIVDLDAAYGAGRNNRDVIKQIRANVSCELEVGGGVRSELDIAELMAIGIDRLILGTVLIKNPVQVADWILEYHFHAIGGIDALEGHVKITGWRGETDVKDTTLASQLRTLGIKELIYTNISRDGTLQGPDIDRTNAVAKYASLPVILSGGISSEADIALVKENKHENVHGIIVGKAIYENKIDLREIIKKYQSYTNDVEHA
ncbi:MAG: 1-(5-phosphoribosyl)-5-[(5-phosphoribosylamino)methylideneamino]imidazole-4-carboxamide isomerase [Spirochaetales bacterium]|nr:1-(5-phosphoribosyl)-5-[(5-phosphoribosylamino)methylideneamino]imidazole-4-carboxamide isomerase [Spirochaetales bacterium]